MVRAFLPLLVLLVGCASAASSTEELPVPSRHPLDLPIIGRLTITENGIGSPPDQNVPRHCSAFQLDETQVRRFIGMADGIDRRDYMHTLDWSPCHARGRVEFEDGRKGTWTIRRFQTGSILFDDNGEVFLFCPDCSWKPFVW